MGHVLGLVPARGASKGLPRKNFRLLAGRPLVAYAADAAGRSGVVDRVILSTDSEAIAELGRAAGLDVPFLRPAELAGDESPMLPVVEHAVASIEGGGWPVEIVALLQPTSPLRRPEHIRRAVELLRETGADSVVSVVGVPPHFSPDYVMRVEEGRLVPFLPEGARITRRQDARPAYVRDGTVYVLWRRTLSEQRSLYGRDCRPMVLPASESLSIDTAEDWADAERRIGDRGPIQP
ncbi:MAG: acylneuraminate cytidylyltransferase family protein [Acidobacteria bacterium]|nr:acylneuraminate cytidylyltransferase family protein [Acidobacteriota bacterium]